LRESLIRNSKIRNEANLKIESKKSSPELGEDLGGVKRYTSKLKKLLKADKVLHSYARKYHAPAFTCAQNNEILLTTKQKKRRVIKPCAKNLQS
jgi:hypothetical protein